MVQTNKTKLHEIISGAVAAAGFELWGIEFHSETKGGLLRIYIDSEKGIKVEDCEKVMRQINSVLTVEDPTLLSHRFEVSSPGVERTLFSLEQYKRFIGHNVKVQLREAVDGKRNFNGKLINVDDNGIISMEREGDDALQFNVDAILKANVLANF